MPSPRNAAFAPAILAILLLCGCATGALPIAGSAQPTPKSTVTAPVEEVAEPPVEQTVAEGCALAATAAQSFVSITSGSKDGTKSVQDPTKVRAAALDFSEGAALVSNPEVQAVTRPADVALTSYADTLEAVLASESNAEDLGARLQVLGESFSAIGEVC